MDFLVVVAAWLNTPIAFGNLMFFMVCHPGVVHTSQMPFSVWHKQLDSWCIAHVYSEREIAFPCLASGFELNDASSPQTCVKQWIRRFCELSSSSWNPRLPF